MGYWQFRIQSSYVNWEIVKISNINDSSRCIRFIFATTVCSVRGQVIDVTIMKSHFLIISHDREKRNMGYSLNPDKSICMI